MAGMKRREFLSTAAMAASASQSSAAEPVRFGIDLFSIRSSQWTPFEYLDYSAKLDAKVVHFSEIRFIGDLEAANLRKVRAHAGKLAYRWSWGCDPFARLRKHSTRRRGRRKSRSFA